MIARVNSRILRIQPLYDFCNFLYLFRIHKIDFPSKLIFPQNDNLGLEMKILKFLRIQPRYCSSLHSYIK